MTSTSPTAASRRPTSRRCAHGGKGVKVVDGAGTEIRYIVFNVEQEAGGQRRRPQGGRPDDRPRRDRGDDLQGHGHAAVLDGAGRVPGRQGVLQGRLRRSRSGQGQGDPRRGRRRDPGRRSTAGTRRPTTGRSRSISGTRSSVSSRRADLFKVNLDSTEWDQYKEEAFDEGHVLLLRPRLVPGLPGRRQLPVAVHA